MRGLSVADMKAHPALMGAMRRSKWLFPVLVPLFVCVGAGVLAAGGYVYRLATRSIECSWNKKKNPEPWNKVAVNQQMKFYAPKIKYSELKNPEGRPILPNE
ncbi:hypothetical protein ScPMuIL_012564 [Solemya velum]